MHAAMMALRTKVCMGGIAFLPPPSMKVMSQPMPTARMTSMTARAKRASHKCAPGPPGFRS